MAPELYLRELYPDRNILSFQETTTVSAEMLQDAQKKSDGVVSLVGEVATDKVAMNMIQMGMTASKFTIFSHHGNTTKDTVLTLRNSLVNAGGFSNMETAEKQVTDVVRFDIHLERSAEGKPYVQRITEIVQLDSAVPYPEYDENDPVNSMNRITAEYYRRQTDRISFDTREILSYDLETDTYYTKNRMTKKTEDFITSHIPSPNERMRFKYFMAEEWGLDKEFEDDALDVNTGDIEDSQLPPDIIKEAKRLANGGEITKEIVEQAQSNMLSEYKSKVSAIEDAMNAQKAQEQAVKDAVAAQEDTDMADDFFEGVEMVKDKTVGIELADEFTIGLFDM
jgi:pilus assembly protein CpaF